MSTNGLIKASVSLSIVMFCSTVGAREIPVVPGNATIQAAVKQAKAGDVLKLAPGAYVGEVSLPEGVRLQGAGVDKTTLSAPGYAIVSTSGECVVISDLHIRGVDGNTRGINSNDPVRIVRCRFTNIPEAIAMMMAPLSDVVHCSFSGCRIGVRAIGQASPTVWGCRFDNCQTGVFCMHGGPYIRNNLFKDTAVGLMLISDEQSVIRNNVFSNCTSTGIELACDPEKPFAMHSIRNCLFDRCGAAVVAPEFATEYISHCAISNCDKPAIHSKEGPSSFKPEDHSIVRTDIKLAYQDDGTVKVTGNGSFHDKGIRLAREAEGSKGYIGLEPTASRPGTCPSSEAIAPPVRFTPPVYISNSVSEEWTCMRFWGIQMRRQSLQHEGDVVLDVFEGAKRKGHTIKFDVRRFFGETSIPTK